MSSTISVVKTRPRMPDVPSWGSDPKEPLRLDLALSEALQAAGVEQTAFYRRGTNAVRVVFLYKGGFWPIDSKYESEVTVENVEQVDDWHFGQIVNVLLPEKMANIHKT